MHCTKATQDTKVMKIDKEKYIFLIKEIKDLILHLLVCLSRSNVALDCLNNPLESCPRIV